LLTDKNTGKYLADSHRNHEKYVSEIKIVDIPGEFSQKESSRWIKTSIRNYVSGDFLFIDCDTIITEKLDYDFPPDIQIGAVLDTHVPLSQHHLFNEFQKRNTIAGFQKTDKKDFYYNSGIIFCRDTPETRVFFNEWHDLWVEGNKRGVSADQPSFNQANNRLNNITTELSGEWNCQISHNGLPYLSDAKIIHYFATSLVSFEHPFIPASGQVLLSIKNKGEIPSDIINLLKKPKAAFSTKARIISDQTALDVLESAFFSKLLWLRREHERVFSRLNRLLYHVKKPVVRHK
jgi:hypothetical protein